MIRSIRTWWRLRRQFDAVKMGLWMVLFCVASLVALGVHGWRLYQLAEAPVEFVGTLWDASAFDKIREARGVTAVSWQQESVVTLRAGAVEMAFPCVTLSAEYLDRVYGASKESAMPVLFMNEEAYQTWEMGTIRYYGFSKVSRVTKMDCEWEDGRTDVAIVQYAVTLPRETGQVYRAVPMLSAENSVTVRIYLARRGLDLEGKRQLEQLGVVIENREQYLEDEQIQEVLLVQMKYEVVLAVVCALAAWMILRPFYGRRVRGQFG